jgi:hypothetical protein
MWVFFGLLLLSISFAIAMRFQRFRHWVCATKFAEGVMLLFTAALTFATIAQFSLLHGQLDVMRMDQRAWVTALPGTADTPKSGTGELLRIPVAITNTGKTIARDVKVILFARTAKNGDDPPCDYAKQPGGTVRAAVTRVFLPSETHTFYATILSEPENSPAKPRVISPDEIHQLTDGDEFFIVYGEVKYRDMFDHQHWRRFCSHGTLSPKAVMITSRTCAGYNDLDDD